MGVYSSLAVQKVNEQNMLENFQFSDLLEFAIDIQKSDQAMFDAMLELDFHEAYESKGIITLTEADKLDAAKVAVKNIWGKIKEALTKFLGMIKTYAAKISNAFAELSGKNKQLTAAIKNLNKVSLSKKLEEHDVEVTMLKVDVDVVNNKIEDLTKIYEKAVDGNDVAGDIKALKDKLSTDQYFVKSSLKDYVDKNDLTALKNNVDNPKKELDGALSNVNALQSMVEKDIADFEKKASAEGGSDEDRAAASKIASNLNLVMDGAAKILSFVKNFYARKAACDRGIYTKLGALEGIKLGAKDAAEQGANVAKAAGGAAKDAAGKAAHAAKHELDNAKAVAKTGVAVAKSKLSKSNEAAEEFDYQCMAIDVMNETYIEQLFA